MNNQSSIVEVVSDELLHEFNVISAKTSVEKAQILYGVIFISLVNKVFDAHSHYSEDDEKIIAYIQNIVASGSITREDALHTVLDIVQESIKE